MTGGVVRMVCASGIVDCVRSRSEQTPVTMQEVFITRGCVTGGVTAWGFVNVMAGDSGAAAGIVGGLSHGRNGSATTGKRDEPGGKKT